jgi:hypothetical protein
LHHIHPLTPFPNLIPFSTGINLSQAGIVHLLFLNLLLKESYTENFIVALPCIYVL